MATPGRGERFSLKWNNFQANYSSAFQKFRKEEELFDITLISCNGHQASAHKLVLAASSRFFQDILKTNPHPHPLIFLKGVEHNELLLLLDFMYNAEVTLLQEELDSFLEAGGALGVKGLEPGDTEQGSATGGAAAGYSGQKNETIPSASRYTVQSTKTSSNTRPDYINGTGDAASENTMQSCITGAVTAVIPKTEFVEGTTEVFIEGHCDYDTNQEGQNNGEINSLDQPEVIVNPTLEQKKNVFQEYTSVKTVDGKKAVECGICGKIYRDQNRLLWHVENCHVRGMFRYLCRHCPIELDTASKLYDHERRAHIKKSV